MAETLVVEDGSRPAGAETYATATELRAYSLARGTDMSAISDADCEELLVKAMDYLQGQPYKGSSVASDQSLDWPRAGAYVDGWLVSSTAIPRQLVYAQCALAIEAQTNDLQPTVTTAGQRGPVTGEAVSGAVSVTYANPGRVLNVPSFAKADALLRTLLNRSGLTAVRT